MILLIIFLLIIIFELPSIIKQKQYRELMAFLLLAVLTLIVEVTHEFNPDLSLVSFFIKEY